MSKEEFWQSNSRIICHKGRGDLARKLLDALRAEIGELRGITISEGDYGSVCDVEIHGFDFGFHYRSRNSDGSLNDNTPENFAREVAEKLK